MNGFYLAIITVGGIEHTVYQHIVDGVAVEFLNTDGSVFTPPAVYEMRLTDRILREEI